MPAHDPATVTATGVAVVRAEPDEALLSLSVDRLAPTPVAALADVTQRGEVLVTLLDEIGIPRADRATIAASVREEFEHTKDGRRSLGHHAATGVAVRVRDPELIGRLIGRAIERVEAEVAGPQWQIGPANPARITAAREAAADAKRTAEAYAQGIGARLGAVVRITDSGAADGVSSSQKLIPARMSAAGADLPIETGEHEVTATVQITFALEQGGS
jgi:uncharacterized protein YggE